MQQKKSEKGERSPSECYGEIVDLHTMIVASSVLSVVRSVIQEVSGDESPDRFFELHIGPLRS